MTPGEFLDETELRTMLRLEDASKRRTWFRLRPLFAPALVVLPTGSRRGHRLYAAGKVRELLDARRQTTSGLSRATTLRRVG